VYVYSETSVLDQPGPSYVTDAQDAAIGTSTNWEGNPAIASDYKTGETSFRVVAYEVAPSRLLKITGRSGSRQSIYC